MFRNRRGVDGNEGLTWISKAKDNINLIISVDGDKVDTKGNLKTDNF